MKKVTLRLNDGIKVIFSNLKEISIFEIFTKKAEDNVKQKSEEDIPKPLEGQWFKVNPLSIDQTLFKKKRLDFEQERTRQTILQAFEELRKHPERAKPFITLMPSKTWDHKTVEELKSLSSQLGDHIADWIEQALEWAQRISNGETWEDICNKADSAHWYRLVIWKNGQPRIVGGLKGGFIGNPSTDVDDVVTRDNTKLISTVPLVILYE